MFDLTLKNAKILIVDDQQSNIDVLVDLLEINTFTNLKSIIDSREVLDTFLSYKPDLILLDLAMPYLSGFEILEQLKTIIPEGSYLPILVLTADITREAKQKALTGGAKDFLIKPFDVMEVLLRIKNLLETRYLYQQLENNNHLLEEKVKERTFELEKTNKELIIARDKAEANDKLKTSFIQNVSHEIRTPLNGILGLTHLFIDPDISADDKKDYIPMLQASSERLVKTVSDYLDISLIVSNNIDLNIKSLNIKNELQELKDNFINACLEKNLILNIQTPDNSDELTVLTDKKAFKNIFSQLIHNAIKFTINGLITIGYKIKDNNIEFFIKDTGVGIDKELQDAIFEYFVQEDMTDTRGFEGSGLGLAIAKGLLGLINGQIRVESIKGQGATFYFSLPYTENTDQNIKDVHNLNMQSDKLPVILIAEDDLTNYIYLEAILGKYTTNFYHAINGIEAVDICKQHPEISIVFMDIKMPILNGVEATKQIKAFRKDLPIFALSALASSEDENQAREAGCDEFMLKPFSIEELSLKLENFGFKKV